MYRENSFKTVKKLPRLKARLRGLWRRIVLPTTVVAIVGAVMLFGISCVFVTTHRKVADANALAADLEIRSKALDSKRQILEAASKTMKAAVPEIPRSAAPAAPIKPPSGIYRIDEVAINGVSITRISDNDSGVFCYLAKDNREYYGHVNAPSIACVKLDK